MGEDLTGVAGRANNVVPGLCGAAHSHGGALVTVARPETLPANSGLWMSGVSGYFWRRAHWLRPRRWRNRGEPIDEIVVVADPLEFLELESSGIGLRPDAYAQTPRHFRDQRRTIARFRIETDDPPSWL